MGAIGIHLRIPGLGISISEIACQSNGLDLLIRLDPTTSLKIFGPNQFRSLCCAPHASDRRDGRDLSHRLETRRACGRARSTDPVDRTANDRSACRRREAKGRAEDKRRKGGGRGGGKRRARNSDESLSACDGTSIFAPSVTPRLLPPLFPCARYRAAFPAFPGGVCATRRACTRDISSISRIKP